MTFPTPEDPPANVVPTTIEEIMTVARENGVSPNGFTEGYSPRRHQGKDHPYGTPEDWLAGNDESRLLQVGMSRSWIRQRVRTKNVVQGSTSYGFKHIVENWGEKYVSNGAFIVAAYLEGLVVKRCEPDNPNAWFNISKRDARVARAEACKQPLAWS